MIDLRTRAMTSCSVSFFVLVMRTSSPWMLAWALSLLSLMSLTIFLASSCSTPTRVVMFCLTLLPEIF